MFFAEVKRKYFNIIFLFVIIIGAFWLCYSLKPRASSTLASYDYYKYNYFKPLNKAEFVYFELVSDYKKGYTYIYGQDYMDSGQWKISTRILEDIEKEYLMDIIKKLNPDYKSSEKMKDVQVKLSYKEIRPYLHKFEENLHINSIYCAIMDKKGDYHKNQDYIYQPSMSPYWIYKNYARGLYNKGYKNAIYDFNMTYKNGISKGYSYVMLDSLGIIMGVISIIYSFMSYAEEKRAGASGFIYTGDTSSVKYVLCKYFSGVVPLMLLSMVYSLIGAACFMYWNYKFNYGYDISIIPFLTQTPFIIFPTVLTITAAGHFTGILAQSGTLSVIIQFILFYLSMGYGLSISFTPALLVRYNNFDDYSLYQEIFKNIAPNRVIIISSAIILTGFTVMLFSYRREHGRLINLKNIIKTIKSLIPLPRKYKTGTEKNRDFVTKGLFYYIFKQSVNKTLLLYVPYICLMWPLVITKNMNVADIAITGENIFIFASIFLFIRLGNMEKANGMESYMYTANVFYPFVYISRVAVASIILFITIEAPVLLLCILKDAAPGRWCTGVYLSSLFIGIFALLITEFLGNNMAGYFSYIMYYLFEIFSKGSMPLSIAGYTYGIEKTKLPLAIAVAVMYVMLPVIVYTKLKQDRKIKKW